MRTAEPTPGDLSDLYLSLPKRDDGDGRDDVSGSRGGVKNTVTIVTTVTEPKRTFVPAAQSADCTADRRRKYYGFPPHLDGGMLRKAEPLAVPYLQCGCHMQTRQRLPQKPQVYPLPAGSPRHFAAGTDESVIMGYYTLKKCVPRQLTVYIQT